MFRRAQLPEGCERARPPGKGGRKSFRARIVSAGRLRVGAVAAVGVVAVSVSAVSVATGGSGLPGQIAQLPGSSGCLSEFEEARAEGCGAAAFLQGPFAMTVSPDGKDVYVASYNGDGVAILSRNPAGGVLTQASGPDGCISSTAQGCTTGQALEGVTDVAVSPDGRNVYTSTANADSVDAFARAASGTLTQLPGTSGCLSEDGSGGACATGGGLTTVFSVEVSADGKNVYSVSNDGITAFARSASGSLSEIGCVTEPPVDTGDGLSFLATTTCVTGVALEEATDLAISPDGRFVYVGGGSAIAVFARGSSGALSQLTGTAGCFSDDGSDGACTALPLLDDSQAMRFSPDGRQLYVLSVAGDRVMTFNRDPASGGLSLAGCISSDGSGGQCASGRALDNPLDLAVSADGASVYVVTNLSSAVAAFARSSSGALSQLPAALGCVSYEGSGGACLTGRSLVSPTAVAVSPDGRNVYVTTSQGTPVVGYDSINLFSRVAPTPPLVKVAIRKTGPGATKVLVTSTPAAIRCGSRCSASFAADTTVTLRVRAPAGYQIQWSAPCKGNAPTCRFQAKTLAITVKSKPPAPRKKRK